MFKLLFYWFIISYKGVKLIHTTTSTLEGKKITKYIGIVTGEAIMGANVIKDFFAGITDIVGGRSAAYEKELQEARRIAFKEMKQQAGNFGANAIVAIDIDYETVNNMLMVSITGTAVKTE